MQVSGSEPTNFNYYRTGKGIIRNNCMAFAFGERGKVDYEKQQPGNKSGKKGVDFSLGDCKELVSRVMMDYGKNRGVYRVRNPMRPCQRGYAKVMAFLAPDADFHFYRQGAGKERGYWEHKRGLTPATKLDACGKRISNPLKACRDYGDGMNYWKPCATFCRKTTTARTAPPLKKPGTVHGGRIHVRPRKRRARSKPSPPRSRVTV